MRDDPKLPAHTTCPHRDISRIAENLNRQHPLPVFAEVDYSGMELRMFQHAVDAYIGNADAQKEAHLDH